MGLTVSAQARRRAHAGTARAPLHAELGSKARTAQARTWLGWCISYPVAFQNARCSVPVPLRMQGSNFK